MARTDSVQKILVNMFLDLAALGKPDDVHELSSGRSYESCYGTQCSVSGLSAPISAICTTSLIGATERCVFGMAKGNNARPERSIIGHGHENKR